MVTPMHYAVPPTTRVKVWSSIQDSFKLGKGVKASLSRLIYGQDKNAIRLYCTSKKNLRSKKRSYPNAPVTLVNSETVITRFIAVSPLMRFIIE